MREFKKTWTREWYTSGAGTRYEPGDFWPMGCYPSWMQVDECGPRLCALS